MIEVYTDGSCVGGGGPGGWAFIMIHNEVEYHVSGGDTNTTNNRMELQAVIEALTFKDVEIQEDIKIYKIYTDSQLTLQCAKGNWKRKANLDLWEVYNEVSRGKEIQWEWVKAHVAKKSWNKQNTYNDMVDKLAKEQTISHTIRYNEDLII